ncbi:MAG TPA: beta-N-acetylhexosaminidase [Candidatus Acidoferrales bacterium]|nr:beta-N-acetylhexosaminidase [Candidatus Acidoferrales bacterium]
MKLRNAWICSVAILAGAICAQSARAADLKLIPQPREVKEMGGAAFTVTRHTRVVVERSMGGANSQGAQMLAEEITRWTGWKPRITDAKEMPGGSDFIYIGDAMEDAKLRNALRTSGLAMHKEFDTQGYAISADSHRILVAGASEQGAFYGVQTLRQLLHPAAADGKRAEENLNCPAVTIRDWPAMKWRGVSIDISRGPIPTLAFMENQIRVLAGYKLNLYGLYMEDVFKVEGNELFAPPDALSAQEITELVAYAKKYYVAIVPELETFGHVHNILRYDIYSDLAEIPHGSVLTPTQPGTYDLIQKLVEPMAKLFTGPFFHIGADETFELGQGQTKQLIAEKGLGQVYLAHIAKLDAMLKPYQKQTMFWADIAEKFSDLLPTLPKDLIAVVWAYEPEDSYDNRLAPFQKAGLPIFVSPGISNWRRLYPDFNAAFRNIANLTRDGQKFGAIGILNTEWKDRGEELGGMDWPGLVFGAACGWQAGESSIEQFRDNYDWAFYRNEDHTFEDILNKLAATNTLLNSLKMDATHVRYFWSDPFSQIGANDATTAEPVTHELRVDAERAWESLLENRSKAKMNASTLDDLFFAAKRLDMLGMKFEYTQEMSEAYWTAFLDMKEKSNVMRNLEVLSSINGDLQDLRESLMELRREYSKRWLAENNEGWLENVLVRYDSAAENIQKKIESIDGLEENFSVLGELPSPESMGFYARPNAGSGIH